MVQHKAVFLSDVHIGVRRFKCERFGDEHANRLCTFLAWIAERGEEVRDLVFLGDVLDNWWCPVDAGPDAGAFPPSLADVIAARPNAAIWTALRRCLRAQSNVFFVPGNHDMGLTEADLSRLRDPKSGKAPRLIPTYLDGLLWAEHGHAHAMFNAPDPIHDPVDHLPLGYFITRLLGSTERSYGGREAIRRYIESFFEAASPEITLSESVLNAFRDLAGLTDATVVRMGGGRRDMTLAEVKARYRDLFDCWTRRSALRAFEAIQAEFGRLEAAAERLLDRYRVVVFGHTHGPTLRYYPRRHKVDPSVPITGIYANTGSFSEDRPTFVEVENLPAGAFHVRLCAVDVRGRKLSVEVLDEQTAGGVPA